MTDIEFNDSLNYRGEDEQYSHELLVMQAMRKCIDLGSKEMRSGYWNTRRDEQGNQIDTYHEDTREAFIEAVKTVEMIMSCYISDDEVADDNIGEIKDHINETKDKFKEYEKKEWEKLSNKERAKRRKEGMAYRPGLLNSKNIYYKKFKDVQVEYYREIFKELVKLGYRLNFFRERVSAQEV